VAVLGARVLSTAALAGEGAAPAVAERPNIVVILADDMGYGDLGSYGSPDTRTPRLDRLAGEGVRFTDFYANAPVCTPTRAAFITGAYQQRARLERPLSVVGETADHGLTVTGRSLPQLLKGAGYATGLVGKWHLGLKPEHGPRAHGFEEFWGFLSGYVDWYAHVAGDGQADLWENETPTTHHGYLHHEVTRRAVDFIDRHRGRAFFLEVAYGAPHWPFQSPSRRSEAVRKGNSMLQRPSDVDAPTRADYVEIVEDLDTQVGRLLDALAGRGLDRRTLVVFLSDNGGEWLSRNAPFFNRKDTVWEGGIRVPAIARWPGVVPAGTVSPQVAITMDLTATILAAARVERGGLRLEGLDLVPVLSGREAPIERTLFWRVIRSDTRQRAARQGRWKYVQDGGLEFLFDLGADPGERSDRAAHAPDRLRDLRALVDAWERDVDAAS
jgi:arylsulfatase A-like enzyme